MGETETMSSWNSLSSSNHCINDDAEVEFISSLPAVLPVVDNTNKNGPNEVGKLSQGYTERNIPFTRKIKKSRSNLYYYWIGKYDAARQVIIKLANQLETVTNEKNELLTQLNHLNEVTSQKATRKILRKRKVARLPRKLTRKRKLKIRFKCNTCPKKFKYFKCCIRHKIMCNKIWREFLSKRKYLLDLDSDYSEEEIPRQCCLCKDFKTQRSPNARSHFFRFPTDAKLRQDWINALKETTFYLALMHNPINEQFDPLLCSVHFEEDCFQSGRLSKNAVPTKFLAENGARSPPPLSFIQEQEPFLLIENIESLADVGSKAVKLTAREKVKGVKEIESCLPLDLSIPRSKNTLLDNPQPELQRSSVICQPSKPAINDESQQQSSLSTENVTNHATTEMFYFKKCPLCKKSFFYTSTYNKHIQNHGMFMWTLK